MIIIMIQLIALTGYTAERFHVNTWYLALKTQSNVKHLFPLDRMLRKSSRYYELIPWLFESQSMLYRNCFVFGRFASKAVRNLVIVRNFRN